MIHDAKIEITCDGNGCAESIEVTPAVTHRSYADEDGEYDTSERAINRLVELEGWSADGDQHLCETCQEKQP